MFLIHLLLSHENVGFKEAFDVQLAFCIFFFMEGKERKVRFLGHKCPRFEKVRETQFPKC